MPIEITKAIEERIIDLLSTLPALKDSDDRLIANFWLQELGGGKKAAEISAYEFLKKYSLGELTMADSITRIRRKVQKEHPELRGETYKLRPEHEHKIEKDLGYHNPTPEPYPDGNGYKP